MALSSIEEILLALAADPGPAPRPGCAAARRRLDLLELVELATEDALRHPLTTLGALLGTVARCSTRRPGRAELAEVLRRRGAHPATESYLETRCVQELRRAGLPDFERQVWVQAIGGRYRLDLVLAQPDGRDIVVEPMGRAAHEPRLDADSRRQAWLTASGLAVVPVTFDTIEHRPWELIDYVDRLLARRAS